MRVKLWLLSGAAFAGLLTAPALPCRGTDTQLPFECPADFVFHIPLMDANGVRYRVPNFLQRPEVRCGAVLCCAVQLCRCTSELLRHLSRSGSVPLASASATA